MLSFQLFQHGGVKRSGVVRVTYVGTSGVEERSYVNTEITLWAGISVHVKLQLERDRINCVRLFLITEDKTEGLLEPCRAWGAEVNTNVLVS